MRHDMIKARLEDALIRLERLRVPRCRCGEPLGVGAVVGILCETCRAVARDDRRKGSQSEQ